MNCKHENTIDNGDSEHNEMICTDCGKEDKEDKDFKELMNFVYLKESDTWIVKIKEQIITLTRSEMEALDITIATELEDTDRFHETERPI